MIQITFVEFSIKIGLPDEPSIVDAVWVNSNLLILIILPSEKLSSFTKGYCGIYILLFIKSIALIVFLHTSFLIPLPIGTVFVVVPSLNSDNKNKTIIYSILR